MFYNKIKTIFDWSISEHSRVYQFFIKKLFIRGAIMFIASFLFIIPNNIGFGTVIHIKQLHDESLVLQNNPNPFAETCQINYYIPSKYEGNAKLILTDEGGVHKLNEIDVCMGKPCQMSISAKDLNTGVYLYGIELNGRMIKSNKMMVIK